LGSFTEFNLYEFIALNASTDNFAINNVFSMTNYSAFKFTSQSGMYSQNETINKSILLSLSKEPKYQFWQEKSALKLPLWDRQWLSKNNILSSYNKKKPLPLWIYSIRTIDNKPKVDFKPTIWPSYLNKFVNAPDSLQWMLKINFIHSLYQLEQHIMLNKASQMDDVKSINTMIVNTYHELMNYFIKIASSSEALDRNEIEKWHFLIQDSLHKDIVTEQFYNEISTIYQRPKYNSMAHFVAFKAWQNIDRNNQQKARRYFDMHVNMLTELIKYSSTQQGNTKKLGGFYNSLSKSLIKIDRKEEACHAYMLSKELWPEAHDTYPNRELIKACR
jgi:hypothetical protein